MVLVHIVLLFSVQCFQQALQDSQYNSPTPW